MPLAGEGFTAFFDGPARAVQCASAVALASGLPLRAGVHIGELDPAATNGHGREYQPPARQAAAPGEVLVSRTIVDLVPGSGLQFDERGTVRPAGDDAGDPGHGAAPGTLKPVAPSQCSTSSRKSCAAVADDGADLLLHPEHLEQVDEEIDDQRCRP